jgi:hypothetical protein
VHDCGPTNVEELREFWRAQWDAIPQAEVDRAVLSFEARLRACRRHGGATIQSW